MKAREELKSILERLERKDPQAQGDAERFLRRHSTSELVELEAGLEREGVAHGTVRHLCPSHRAVTRGSRDAFRVGLADGHPIAVLMDEHLRILARLERLEELAARARLDLAEPDAPAFLKEIEDLAAHLIGVEPHHQREEQVLFPELRKRGVHGPPAVMEAEHVELRALKHSVRDAAQAMLQTGEAALWSKLRGDAQALVATLRQHIEKEDGILFPLAVEAIQGEDTWRELALRCDQIGYCCGSEHQAEPDGGAAQGGCCGGW